MNKKILYANGDSFVFGMECIGDMNKDPENKHHAFPKHLADLMGCDTWINNAYNGATNNFIFRRTFFDLKQLETQVDLKDVFVLIGFSSLHRTEVDADAYLRNLPKELKDKYPEYDNKDMGPMEMRDHDLVFVNPRYPANFEQYYGIKSNTDALVPFFGEFLWWESVLGPHTQALIMMLHEWLEMKGVDHLFVNTVAPLERIPFDECKNYYNLNTDAFYTFAKWNFPEEIRKHNHFSPVAHQAYAEKLFEYIQNTFDSGIS